LPSFSFQALPHGYPDGLAKELTDKTGKP
jgi:hypothetical protein